VQNKEQGHITHQKSEGAQQRRSAPQGGPGDRLLKANIHNSRFGTQKDSKVAGGIVRYDLRHFIRHVDDGRLISAASAALIPVKERPSFNDEARKKAPVHIASHKVYCASQHKPHMTS
jgi:hypothetical protein